MFDVGWSEMLVIAVVLIVVVGPKDLPRMLRQFGRTTANLRAMAGDFRRQFDEALKEADLEDVSETLSSVRKINPMNEIRKHLAPIEDVGQQVRAGLDDALKPQTKVTTAETSTEAIAAEPLKNGAAELPGEAAPAAETARPKKSPARGKTATAKAGAAKAGSAKTTRTISANPAGKAVVAKAAGKASPKPAAAKAPAAKAQATKASAAKAPAAKTSTRVPAAKASAVRAPATKSARSATAKEAPAKAGPASRKKTESTR